MPSPTPTINPALPKNPPCHLAVECAVSIANYCLTRFPCDTPPHPMLDVAALRGEGAAVH